MKTIVTAPSCKQLFYSAILFSFAAFTSCKKETAQEQGITSEEAAEVMSQSITESETGVVAYFEGHASVTDSTTTDSTSSDSTVCTFNHTFDNFGRFVSSLRRNAEFSKKTTFKAINVVVNRATKKIVSGTVEIVLQGTNSEGQSFYYTATFTFHGNGIGTLLLQNGQRFNVSW